MELWSLMHFLMPTIFSSHDDFKDWFSNPLTGMMEGSMEFNAPLIQRLHKVLRPFILRRLKKEVEKQLPEKTEHVINCSLSKRQRYLYDDFMSRRSTKENLKSGNMMSVLNIVMQLRKCCNHPNLFEPRPVLAPFVVQKIQTDLPAYMFEIAEQKQEEPIPEIFNLRFGWQTQVSSKKPLIEEIRAMETVEEPTPPLVEGFRFNRTAFIQKNNRTDEGIGSEEEVKMNGNNGVVHANVNINNSSSSSASASASTSAAPPRPGALIRTRTVMNTAPLTITTDRSGFHYTMANNGRNQLDENAPQSPPLKRSKMSGEPTNWADCVPRHVIEKMEASKRAQLEIVRRRFGQIRKPVIANELIALLMEEVTGEIQRLAREKDDTIQETLSEYIDLLGERFGMFVEPVLADAWQCRPSSSGLPSYIRHNMDTLEQDSRRFLLQSSSNLDTKMSIGRSLQFPELRLIEYDCGKLQTLAVLLRQLYIYKHRCLIFTQMSKMLDVLQTFLSHHGYQYFRLDGTTGVEQRQAMMERFNADPKIFCFILSTRSGGVGVNLTGADTVIFYDSDWNPTMDAQAQDRCHRIGQTRNVSIYRLISERTIEENILKKAMQKKRLGELAIDEAGFTPAFFKQTDSIRDLFDGEGVDVEAPKDVPKNEKEMEKAMATCEDEADVNAAKVAVAEARVDVAEFDENSKMPTSNLDGDEEADEKYMELIQQLKPIERFAINLLEAEYKPEFEEECKEAEEAHVLSRIAELRKNGLWSNSRLPKCVEPERNKTHWDYLLEEVKWMATDFRTETNNKKKFAKIFAHGIAKQHRDKEIEVERAAEREIKDKKKMCAGIAKMIRDFWQGVDKVVDIRAKEILESRLRKARNKHLMFMIGQVDEMSNIVQERLVPSKTPSIVDDDKEFDAANLSESDDERTIANAEKSIRKDDVKEEVSALQDEANADMDDFLWTLPPEYLLAEFGLTSEDLEEMKRQKKLEREQPEAPKVEEMEVDVPSTSTSKDSDENKNGEKEKEEEEEREEERVEKSQNDTAEDGNGDGRGVLLNVDYLKLNSNDSDIRQQELANIAEEALKFQPKGYTLETTQVKTPVPFLIRGELREYQMVGLDWMVTLYEKNLNGILADEMGLGKTIQTISLIAHLACHESIWGPHLIIVPTSVILNWEMEFKKWCPALKILTYFGSAKERAEKRKGWMKPNCFHVCITSYKTVTTDIRAFKQRVLFMNHPLSTRQILATTVVFSALTADVVDGKLSGAAPAAVKKPKEEQK
uniref:Uncharacterized protein n=1 Tax=Caenorhabditis japonica TaxID=281687 RepID=A0A8R1HSQ0_CAEJA